METSSPLRLVTSELVPQDVFCLLALVAGFVLLPCIQIRTCTYMPSISGYLSRECKMTNHTAQSSLPCPVKWHCSVYLIGQFDFLFHEHETGNLKSTVTNIGKLSLFKVRRARLAVLVMWLFSTARHSAVNRFVAMNTVKALSLKHEVSMVRKWVQLSKYCNSTLLV